MEEASFTGFVTDHEFVVANTMKGIPHSYLVRKRSRDSDEFSSATHFIRDNGFKRPFYRKVYAYYRVGDYAYWTMGAAVEETVLINRAHVSTIRGGVPDDEE
ncbi:MAG: hypothetical protein EXQ74_05655 [Thermoleophilia bacterium]|nr:hypothetical protein [Thermoleophilia bacterium]